MRSYRCACSQRLFFHDHRCHTCGVAVGFCTACRQVTPLTPDQKEGTFRCGNHACGKTVVRCGNGAFHGVCNRCIPVDPRLPTPPVLLCDYCQFNRVIPDLSVPGNIELWAKIEDAKRTVLHELDLIGLPRGDGANGFQPPLSFEFMADPPDPDAPPVTTGHLNGVITIHLREADSVERERARQMFGEIRRTLTGHFRHEFGHYYWDALVRGRDEDACAAVFGDHRLRRYDHDMFRHYEQGPPDEWRDQYATPYAAMHPWEDFAATVELYLEMVCLLDTAANLCMGGPGITDDLDAMCVGYELLIDAVYLIQHSLFAEESRRSPLAPTVKAKLRYIHGLITAARTGWERSGPAFVPASTPVNG